MSLEYIFIHDLKSPIVRAANHHEDYRDLLEEGKEADWEEFRKKIITCRNFFLAWLGCIIECGVDYKEFPKWFDLAKARELQQRANFNWENYKIFWEFVKWFNQDYSG